MHLFNYESERVRAHTENLVKQYRAIGPAALMAALTAAKMSLATVAPAKN